MVEDIGYLRTTETRYRMSLVYEVQEFSDILTWYNNSIGKTGRLGLTSANKLAEDVYARLLNALYGWSLENLNGPGKNEEAVDLIDDKNRIVVQVTATCGREKINSTLESDKVDGYRKGGYHLMFAFVGYQHDAKKVKNKDGWTIRDHHGIGFDRQHDALFTEDLESRFRQLGPRDRIRVLELVRADIGTLPQEGGADGQTGHADFYEWECDRFYGDTGSELYGEMPLSECYIEPTVRLGDEEPQSVQEFIESWADSGSIAVICGEPGHGKTSLCRKAVCDFHKSGWLAGRVTNVFHFSLNPRNTDALADDCFYFYSLLSWGDDRKSEKRKVGADDCKGALVFLDGFDELVEWHPRFNLEGFIKNCIIPFQRETKSHVIVTSRSIVVDPHKDAYTFDHPRTRVPIARLQLLPKDQQVAWIETYAKHCRGTQSGALEKDLENLDEYLEKYKKLEQDEEMQSVMGVPIILRMIVAARYPPASGQSVVQIYENLFSVTWERHKHREGRSSVDQEETDKASLSRHALRIFCDNNDTAYVDSIEESPWLFSFYTTHEGGSRVGFLHRSFYQYFLAHEILSWFKRYKRRENAQLLRESLSCLAVRRIDSSTLQYVRDLYVGLKDKKALDNSFSRAYEVLKETDGFLPLFAGAVDSQAVMETSPLERANNVFWNVVSVCSICGHEATSERVSIRALQLYDLAGCTLVNAKLKNLRLVGAKLDGTDLRGAHLVGADLRWTRLVGAKLDGADLEGANLEGADLRRASLVGAKLDGAYLRKVRLDGACLGKAKLEGAYLVKCFCQPIVPQIHDGRSPLSWRGIPHPHDRVSKPAVSS